jgi:FixJ family two-component response regulator
MPTPTVFVVDDDQFVREALESMIRRAGLRAEVFGSAQAFLAYPETEAPKCLVLDVSLPGMGGLDLQNWMNVHQPDTPIIFLVAQADVSTTVRAMRAGAFDFFTKPFAEDELLQAVLNAIERSEKLRLEEAALQPLRDR